MHKITILTALLFIVLFSACHHHHDRGCNGCEDQKITITNPTTCSNSTCKSNGFVDPCYLIDNDNETYSYITMSKYDEMSVGNLYINFFDYHNLNGIDFKYSVPNTDSSNCYKNYPGVICHTYKYELSYLKDDKWIVVDSAELEHAGNGCQVMGHYYGNFDAIGAKHWKFTIYGNYWLGANYQTATYFKVYGVNFKERCL